MNMNVNMNVFLLILLCELLLVPTVVTGCLTIDFVPDPWVFLNRNLQMSQTVTDVTYSLFDRDGMLITSGQNSTRSSLCNIHTDLHNQCHYLLVQGHGNVVVVWEEQQVMEQGHIELDNPKLIVMGNCKHQCGDLSQLTVFDGGDTGDASTLNINRKASGLTMVCMKEDQCYDILGNAAYIVSTRDNTMAEIGNTYWGYKEFGDSCDTFRKCSHKPLLAGTERGEHLTVILSSISGMESLKDTNSSEYQAACWLIHDDQRKLEGSDSNVVQRYVLALLYFSLQGFNWIGNYDFLSHKHECEWNKLAFHPPDSDFWHIFHQSNYFLDGDGVHCNEFGDVSSIVLGYNNLVGTIPEELSWLSNCQFIDLSENEITGRLPSELGSISNLQILSAYKNFLTGAIPESIVKKDFIQVIQLDQNALTGSVTEFSTNLMWLALNVNFLTGTLPSQIGDLNSLRFLMLFQNQFSGTIPEKMGSMQSLQYLNLGRNLFSGTIPENFESMLLASVTLFENHLSGTIPSKMLSLPRLDNIWLNNNYLSGTIPNEVASDSPLNTIRLYSNQLTGTIPSELMAFKSLAVLYIEDNKLTGEFPLELAGLESLNDVSVHINDLTGTIPFENCQQFTALMADCDSPGKVVCPCCTTCYGMYSREDDDSMDCASGELSIVFENLQIGKWGWMGLYNDAGETLIDYAFPGNASTDTYSTCISITDCFHLLLVTSFGLDMKVAVNSQVILEENIMEMVTNHRFGFSSDGMMQKDRCDNLNVCNLEIAENSTKRQLVNKLSRIEDLEFDDTSSVKYKALCGWLNYIDVMDSKESGILQNYFLAIIYYTTAGEEWNNSTLWLSDKHYCDWYGVECDRYNIVTSINMNSNRLIGTIPTAIGGLRGLKELSLGDNDLTGTIPEIVGIKLTHLVEFNMSRNGLVGGIPSGFLSLTTLLGLDLSHNRFSYRLPVDIGRLGNLQTLNVFNNSFKGTLPDSLYELTDLKTLILGSNLFVGDVLRLKLFRNLEHLDLSENIFTSFLPVSDRHSNLRILKLYKNEFHGTISVAIENSPFLEEVMLFDNQLTGNLPFQFGNLPNLKKLSVSHNKLKGSIPPNIGNAKNLILLHLHNNELEGRADFFDHRFDYITDCGSVFYAPALVQCANCSSCCSVDGICLRTNSTWPGEFVKSLDVPPWFATFVLIVLGCVGTVATIFLISCFTNRELDFVSLQFQEGSSYRLILANNVLANLICVVVVLLQLSIVGIFIRLSDFTQSQNDWSYSLNCDNTDLTCSSTRYLSNFGWMVFTFIFLVYITKDIIQGLQMVYESSRLSHIRGIIAGFIVLLVSASVTTASILYNYSTSSSDSDIIKDAVILLFLIEIDEKVYEIIEHSFSEWVSQREHQICDILHRRDEKGSQWSFEEENDKADEEQFVPKIHLGEQNFVAEENLDGPVLMEHFGNEPNNFGHEQNNFIDQQKLCNNEQKQSIDELKLSSDEQKKLINELKLLNDEHTKSIDELKLSNNELKLSNNEIRLSNYDLKLSNDALNLSNNELKESNNELKNVVYQMREGNDQLLRELGIMKQELEQLKKNMNS